MHCEAVVFKNPLVSLILGIILAGLMIWKAFIIKRDGFSKKDIYELCFLFMIILLLAADGRLATKCRKEIFIKENVRQGKNNFLLTLPKKYVIINTSIVKSL